MGACAFIFLSPYSLNKDPYCFLFSELHLQSNKIFHWREKNTPRQGNTTHLPTEECEEGKNAITALRHAKILNSPNAQSCSPSHWLWCRHTFLIMLSKSLMNLVWLSLSLISSLQHNLHGMWEVQNSSF